MKTRMMLAVGLSAALFAVGCEDKKDAPKAAASTVDKMKDSASKGVEAAKDAGAKSVDAAKEAASKSVDAAKDTAAKGVEAAKDAGAKGIDAAKEAAAKATETAKAEVTKWVSDTVEKQWPEAKKTLADLGTKAAGIKDAGIKAKIEESLKSLTGQSTDIEALVTKLKGASGADIPTLLASAKEKFSSFMKKLDEVKGMMPK